MAWRTKKASSNISQIANLDALASTLSIPTRELLSLSSSIDSLWLPGKKLRKANGDVRQTSDARLPLKIIHERIKNRLLKKVDYPYYLLGGIHDSLTPRDYARHSQIHAGKTILISEDIANFFPSTTAKTIRSAWQRVFNFHPEIAEILTKLTTHNDSLPQGWKTSTYLANLVFWDREPFLVERFEKRGLSYSRFMDDITVSSRSRLRNSEKEFVVSEIYTMLLSKGYSLKRSKHRIASCGHRMQVTGLNVNGCRPSMPKEERKKIRSMVHTCEARYERDGTTEEYERLWNTTSGKVGTLTRFHKSLGGKLRERMRRIKPK